MADSTETKSLYEIGFDTLKLFKRVKSINDNEATHRDEDWPFSSIAAESDRFELWSVDIGLFVPRHGSLDYRLRQAESLKNTVGTFLASLKASLEEVLEYWTSENDSVFPESSNDPGLEDEADSQEMGSETDLLLDGIRDPIDRLYKVSTWIRNPSSRFASSKALHLEEIDTKSNVDFDYDCVSSVFLQYRKTKAPMKYLDSNSSTLEVQEKNAKHIMEPITEPMPSRHQSEDLKETELLLVRRIARANVCRRQQFTYWKKHRDKLSKHSTTATQNVKSITAKTVGTDAPSVGVAPRALSVTAVSNLQTPQLAIEDNKSQVSVSEYAPSLSSNSNETVHFPPAPQVPPDAKFFECPYCFTVCPKATFGQKAWKAHLIHDLRPYICTYPTCKHSDLSYDTRQDWIRHESTHREMFRCPEHQLQTFDTRSELQKHLTSKHSNFDQKISEMLAKHTSGSTLMSPDRDCPVCLSSLSSAKALQDHIALHLERFSLFSLPRNMYGDQSELEDADSQHSIIAAHESGTEDSQGFVSSTPSSEASGQYKPIPEEEKPEVEAKYISGADDAGADSSMVTNSSYGQVIKVYDRAQYIKAKKHDLVTQAQGISLEQPYLFNPEGDPQEDESAMRNRASPSSKPAMADSGWIWSPEHNQYYYSTFVDGNWEYTWQYPEQFSQASTDSRYISNTEGDPQGDEYALSKHSSSPSRQSASAGGKEAEYKHTSESRQGDPIPEEEKVVITPKYIAGTSGERETLDKSYKQIKKPAKFFTRGRVFTMLWMEPASSYAPSDTWITQTRLNENVYSAIRRFVVVKERDRHCLCVPITTYGRQGATKRGIRPEDHAIIYTGNEIPPYLEGEEGLTKDALQVIGDRLDNLLDPLSRVNFGKVYTVEHNVKVKNVGLVALGSMAKLKRYYEQIMLDE